MPSCSLSTVVAIICSWDHCSHECMHHGQVVVSNQPALHCCQGCCMCYRPCKLPECTRTTIELAQVTSAHSCAPLLPCRLSPRVIVCWSRLHSRKRRLRAASCCQSQHRSGPHPVGVQQTSPGVVLVTWVGCCQLQQLLHAVVDGRDVVKCSAVAAGVSDVHGLPLVATASGCCSRPNA